MFKPAKRQNVFLKLALVGPSGSGKTMSALKLAKGLIKDLPPRTEKHEDGSTKARIALVDTENDSASYYEKLVNFDSVCMNPPFTTEKYLKAIKDASEAGYDVLILDSISHAWTAEGGLLEQKESLDMGGGSRNTYTNWKPITKKHQAFISGILQSKIHLIATMRAKSSYVIEEKNGKQVPVKVGLEPIQRDGMEFEFGVVFDIDQEHMATASKDRTSLFDGKNFRINESTGEELNKWLKNDKSLTESKVSIPNMAPGKGPIKP
jgi:AAA domain